MSDYTAPEADPVTALARAKRLDPGFLAGLGVRPLDRGGVGVAYFDAAGNEVLVRRRNPEGTTPRFTHPAGVGLLPYGLWRLDEARKARHLYLAEGESDTWALWATGLPALGLPGAQSARVLEADHLVGVESVIVAADSDHAGQDCARLVADRLRALRFAGKACAIRLPEGTKDLSDLRCQDPDAFADELVSAVERATPLDLTPPPPPRSPNRGVSSVSSVSSVKGVSSVTSAKPYRPLPPWSPFPAHCLPPVIRELALEGAEAMQADPAAVALPALAAVASVIGLSRAVILKPGWTEPACIWAAVIAGSGQVKSPCQDLATFPLTEVQFEWKKEHKARMAEWNAQTKAIKAMLRDHRPEPPEQPPKPKKLVVPDVTYEALGPVLEENARGTLVGPDELDSWFGGLTRYKKDSSDRSRWLQLSRAGTYACERITRDSIFIQRAMVSVCGNIQPGVFGRAMSGDAFESGLPYRFLLAMPPRRKKKWETRGVRERVRQDYRELIESMLALPWEGQADRSPDIVGMTVQAQARWAEFFDWWADEQHQADGERAGVLAKLEGYCARLALLHHVVSKVAAGGHDRDAIGVESLDAAITLVGWFANEAERVMAMSREESENAESRSLAEWLQRKGGSGTSKELQHASGSKYPTAELARSALQGLVDMGVAHWEACPPGPRGGRPTQRVVMDGVPNHDTDETPLTDQTDETDDTPYAGQREGRP